MAAAPRGGAAAGPEGREQRGRGAAPGAAVAARQQGCRQTNTKWVGGKEKPLAAHNISKCTRLFPFQVKVAWALRLRKQKLLQKIEMH